MAAEKQGMLAASYFWVGSEADVQGVRPTYYKPYDSSVPHLERIESVLDWPVLSESVPAAPDHALFFRGRYGRPRIGNDLATTAKMRSRDSTASSVLSSIRSRHSILMSTFLWSPTMA